MKKTLPASITSLLNGAALPAPVRPVRLLDLDIPTDDPDPARRYRQARQAKRFAAWNAKTDFNDPRFDLPF